MLNLSPSNYRKVEVDRDGNVIKVFSKSRPWWDIYDPNVGKERKDDPESIGYEVDYREPGEEYFGNIEDDPVTSIQVEALEQLKPSSPNPRYEQTPTSPVTLANVNLREAVLVALGGASAAVVLLLVMAGVFCARRRKNSPSPVPSPPILVYPPHDITAPCYLVSSLNSEVLCPPTPTQYRSNSFILFYSANTTEIGVLDPALYKADCHVEDYLWPEGHVGRVWFTLKYESETERLQIHIIKVKHLPSRTPALANACDPYIRIQLMPDERRVLQTKQKNKTCNPFFDETFVYQIPPGKLESLTLKLSVLDSGRVGRNKPLIGHIILPLSELEGVAPDEEPQLYKMDIEKDIQEPTSDLGEVQVSLLYNENLHRLTVTVIEARGLKLDPMSRREMVARVTQERACRGVRARRTAAVEVSEEGSALISECFHFRLRSDELHTTSVTVQALQPHSVYAKDRLLGKFVLGSYMFARGRALQHWNSAIGNPMESVKQWHPLTN
ncbi:synaptotagmin-15-like isoform X3 [Pieris napi]|uniref:synaptotagmin-15-like isoform X3 n=1 Tax=Pieris napi TaxID=78633 RepID=UPI001FB88693|nr:synaptotagmin-15-like isoform X3 [Pieris napi]